MTGEDRAGAPPAGAGWEYIALSGSRKQQDVEGLARRGWQFAGEAPGFSTFRRRIRPQPPEKPQRG